MSLIVYMLTISMLAWCCVPVAEVSFQLKVPLCLSEASESDAWLSIRKFTLMNCFDVQRFLYLWLEVDSESVHGCKDSNGCRKKILLLLIIASFSCSSQPYSLTDVCLTLDNTADEIRHTP